MSLRTTFYPEICLGEVFALTSTRTVLYQPELKYFNENNSNITSKLKQQLVLILIGQYNLIIFSTGVFQKSNLKHVLFSQDRAQCILFHIMNPISFKHWQVFFVEKMKQYRMISLRTSYSILYSVNIFCCFFKSSSRLGWLQFLLHIAFLAPKKYSQRYQSSLTCISVSD